MSRRWIMSEDLHLATFFESVGDLCGRDLGRQPGAAAKRVKRLKECGAWEPLQAFLRCSVEHTRAYYKALGMQAAVDLLDDIEGGHGS